MRFSLRGLWLPTALTLGTVAWRVGVMPRLSGLTARYVGTYACLLVWLVAAIFVWRKNRRLKPRAIEGCPARPVGTAALLAGVAITATGLYEGFRLLSFGAAPAPSLKVVSGIDLVLLLLTLLFSVPGGIYLLYAGRQWRNGNKLTSAAAKSGFLLPLIWLWMRLARYVISYTFAVHFSYTVFELLMLGAAMLFIFVLGRHIATADDKSESEEEPSFGLLHTAAFFTVVAGFSAVLSRLGMTLFWPKQAAQVLSIAGAADVAIALFAAALIWYWHVLPVKRTDEDDEREPGQLFFYKQPCCPSTEAPAEREQALPTEAYKPTYNGDNG